MKDGKVVVRERNIEKALRPHTRLGPQDVKADQAIKADSFIVLPLGSLDCGPRSPQPGWAGYQ